MKNNKVKLGRPSLNFYSAIVSLALLFFICPQVGASSFADSWVHTTDQLLMSNSSNTSCGEVAPDFSNANFLQSAINASSATYLNDFISLYNTNKTAANGIGLQVKTLQNGMGGPDNFVAPAGSKIIVLYAFDNSKDVLFLENGYLALADWATVRYLPFTLTTNTNCSEIALLSTGSDAGYFPYAFDTTGLWYSLLSDKIVYPSGYEGLDFPDSNPFVPPITYPDIYSSYMYAVTDGLDVKISAVAVPGGQPTTTTIDHFLIKFDGSDDDFYEVPTDLITPHCDLSGCFYSIDDISYTFDSSGDKQTFMTVVDQYDKSLTINVKYYVTEGKTSSYYGSSAFDDSGDLPCDSKYSNKYRVQVCKIERMLSFGLLNPSINALRNLFLSFLVTEPACDFSFSDIDIEGRIFPFSTLPGEICTQSDKLFDAFPLSAVITNFFLAYMLLVLIIAIINRITRASNDNLIEGIK